MCVNVYAHVCMSMRTFFTCTCIMRISLCMCTSVCLFSLRPHRNVYVYMELGLNFCAPTEQRCIRTRIITCNTASATRTRMNLRISPCVYDLTESEEIYIYIFLKYTYEYSVRLIRLRRVLALSWVPLLPPSILPPPPPGFRLN